MSYWHGHPRHSQSVHGTDFERNSCDKTFMRHSQTVMQKKHRSFHPPPPDQPLDQPYEGLLNVPMFQPPKNQWKTSRRFDSCSLAKWSQPDMERHSCGHPGKLIHANHINDTMWSSSSTAEESKVRQHHPLAYFHSHSIRDSWTNQYRWSMLIRQPFVSFRRSKWNLILVPENICADPNFQFGCFCGSFHAETVNSGTQF